jgi:putative oxidoreductase
VLAARLILGGMYTAGGLVPFIHWADLPMPNPAGGQFMQALVDSDLLKVSKTLEVLFGFALVADLWAPLAIAVLGPELLFIAWVDWYLDPFPAGVVAVNVLFVCHLFLAYAYWDVYRPMFIKRLPR